MPLRTHLIGMMVNKDGTAAAPAGAACIVGLKQRPPRGAAGSSGSGAARCRRGCPTSRGSQRLEPAPGCGQCAAAAGGGGHGGGRAGGRCVISGAEPGGGAAAKAAPRQHAQPSAAGCGDTGGGCRSCGGWKEGRWMPGLGHGACGGRGEAEGAVAGQGVPSCAQRTADMHWRSSPAPTPLQELRRAGVDAADMSALLCNPRSLRQQQRARRVLPQVREGWG